MPVGDLKNLVRHDVLVRVAHALRCHAGGQEVGTQVGEHGHLGVEQGHVDDLAFAGEVAVAQCCQDRGAGVHAGEQVGDRHAHFLRTAAALVVTDLGARGAGHAHQPAHPLYCVVVAGALAVWAGLAEAGDRAVNEARVQFAQAGGVQAVARHVAYLVIFNQHIALRGNSADHRLSFGPGDVDRDRALVAVGAEVVGGLSGVLARPVLQERWTPAAGVVTTTAAWAGRTLDLDHISPQIGQRLRAPRTRQHAGQVKYAHAGQRLARRGVLGGGRHANDCAAPAQANTWR